MHPILAQLGPLTIRSYGVMVALGIIMGTLVAYRLAKRAGRYENDVFDFVFYAVLGAVAGARIWEVAFSWSSYADRPLEALFLWHGGLSIQGALAGGLIVALWFTRSRKINFWQFADIIAPGVIFGQALGRIGCFLNGDAYGIPTGAPFGVVYQPGTPAFAAYGSTPLVPAELFEAGWDLMVLGLLLLFRQRRPREGSIFLAYGILYSLGRFALEFWRGDSLQVFGLKTAQIASLAVILAGAAVLWRRKQRRPAAPEQSS
jgi:phosphatidylglycerol:prolipoprotein diacylglycerol transferase